MLEIIAASFGAVVTVLGTIMVMLLKDIRAIVLKLQDAFNEFKQEVYRDYVTHDQLKEHCRNIHGFQNKDV